ncbi:MAG: glycosyltransferase family 39 protein [Planctomycetota bacterium]
MNRLGVVIRQPMFLAALASAWLCLSLPVVAQEAYYWSYAQHPALSYFDHPPMVAWLIWLGTQLFGDGAAGIRFGTWLCGVATSAIGVALLREFGVDRAGRNLWLLLGIAVPAMVATRWLANPDPPLVAAWMATVYALWRARAGSLGAWLIAGVAAGITLLSKYTAAFLAVGGVLVLVFDPMMRRQLLRPGPWLAVLVAAVVFLPVIVWNVQHDFASFKFQTEGRLAKAHFGLHWFVQMAGIQFGMINPAVAVALPFLVAWSVRRALAHDLRLLWLMAFGLPLPLYLAFNSFWIQVKANWFTPAYAILLVAAVVWWQEHAKERVGPRLRRAATVALVGVVALLPLAPAIRLIRPGAGTSWIGWQEIAAAAETWEDRTDLAQPPDNDVFFFAANYRDAAQLAHSLALHWREHPHADPQAAGQPVLAQNVLGDPALQFDQWTDARAQIGRDAIFVLPRPEQREIVLERVRQHFRSIERVEDVEVRRLGCQVMTAHIYVCRGYLGPKVAAVSPGGR